MSTLLLVGPGQTVKPHVRYLLEITVVVLPMELAVLDRSVMEIIYAATLMRVHLYAQPAHGRTSILLTTSAAVMTAAAMTGNQDKTGSTTAATVHRNQMTHGVTPASAGR
jgi:hypothetical protein